jgi:hypothetical protein
MKGFTVNIADFRCRGVARATVIQHRPTRGLHGLGNPRWAANLHEEPAVFDIGVVRETRRLEHRTAFETICIERKAKVLRFRNVIPIQSEVRMEQARGAEWWSATPNGSFDPPPAA